MQNIQRRSPVVFYSKPAETTMWDDWQVVLEYEEQGQGPWVVDLSHRPRWDLQDHEISTRQPFGISIPETPGQSAFDNGILINRMNRTQASIWHLTGDKLDIPDDPAFTDVTDAAGVEELVEVVAERCAPEDLVQQTGGARGLGCGAGNRVEPGLGQPERPGEEAAGRLGFERGDGSPGVGCSQSVSAYSSPSTSSRLASASTSGRPSPSRSVSST